MTQQGVITAVQTKGSLASSGRLYTIYLTAFALLALVSTVWIQVNMRSDACAMATGEITIANSVPVNQNVDVAILLKPAPTAANGKSENQSLVDYSDLEKALPNARFKTRNPATTNTNGRCDKPSGRRILINYASHCCRTSQPKNCETGVTVGGFDICIMFNETSLDEEFRKQNQKILAEGTGGGLWLWKPYIVMKTLSAMRDNDVLFYADSGTHFNENIDKAHVCLMEQLGMDIALFSDCHYEHTLTKPDAFVLMDTDVKDPKYGEGRQLTAAFTLFKKSFRSVRFVGQWLAYAQDYRIIGNAQSQFGQNPPDFIGHRNDQSIISLLSKKWDLEIFPDPSQWGDSGFNLEKRKTERYRLINKTFIQHTRDKS